VSCVGRWFVRFDVDRVVDDPGRVAGRAGAFSLDVGGLRFGVEAALEVDRPAAKGGT
jgi:hypothetical protein